MSEAKYRMLPDDINVTGKCRGSDGQMVPFSAFSPFPLGIWFAAPWNAITVCLDGNSGSGGAVQEYW